MWLPITVLVGVSSGDFQGEKKKLRVTDRTVGWCPEFIVS